MSKTRTGLDWTRVDPQKNFFWEICPLIGKFSVGQGILIGCDCGYDVTFSMGKCQEVSLVLL